jgi:hypothetical protein
MQWMGTMARLAAPSLVFHFKISTGFVRPEQEIEFRRIDSSLLSEFSHPVFDNEVLFFGPGGLGESMTPSSLRVRKMCLSRIAYPK